MSEVRIFTQSSEWVDTIGVGPDALGTIESIMYGDLSVRYDDGEVIPYIVQIPMDEEAIIAGVNQMIEVNADCYGSFGDTVELVLF